MKELITIESISQLHEMIGYSKPNHPLVSVLDYSKFRPNPSSVTVRFVTNFYMISLKTPAPKSLRYGKSYYDFTEGTLMFVSPNQVISADEIDDNVVYDGWGCCFHADLINEHPLAKKMKNYSFFSYSISEALHVSEDEKLILNQVVTNIAREYQGNLDRFSHPIITTYLEQLLNYSERFYNRQFITRQKPNSEIVTRFKNLLKQYFEKPALALPTVDYFASKLALSSGYLSDLLKSQTGFTTKEHIHLEIIEQAKISLLNSNKTVNEIAYDLGFEYPQYFNRLFKSKTGKSPSLFRNR
jgi:AraC family transcriptional regulator, transcriptional activator of pobA